MTTRVRSMEISYGTTTAYAEGRSALVSHVMPNYTRNWTVSPSLGGETVSMVDEVVPDFHRRVRTGEIFMNPLTKTTVITRYPSPATWQHNYTSNSTSYCALHNAYHKTAYETRGASASSVVPVSKLSDDAVATMRQRVYDSALTQAYANIDVSEMMVLATAAEGRKTVQSMENILRRVFKIARNVRKLRFKALAKELSPNELADRYMEARYALRPLLMDAAGICAAVEKNLGKYRTSFRGSASDRMEAHAEGSWTSLQYLVESRWGYYDEYEVSARAGVLCDVSLAELSVFGADQIAETVWELLPYTFIIDWFCNAGDWIAAHTPNVGVNQRASWVTVKSRRTRSTRLLETRSTAASSGFTLNNFSFNGSLERSSEEQVLSRTVNPSVNFTVLPRLRLDEFKLVDLGIILRKIIS